MEMRAIVLDGPGEPEDMRVRRIAVPEPETGWVRIKVEAPAAAGWRRTRGSR